jgi:hypothetical protein
MPAFKSSQFLIPQAMMIEQYYFRFLQRYSWSPTDPTRIQDG